MNTGHRKVAKLRKQGLSVLKIGSEREYEISAGETYRMASRFVTDASNAIREFKISILDDDRKWEETG